MLSLIKRQPLYSAMRQRMQNGATRFFWNDLMDQEAAGRILALAESRVFAEHHMQGAIKAASKDVIRNKAIEAITMPDGLNLEFGVWSGKTINRFADQLGSARQVHGFDSFEGLPEDWFGQFTKGRFGTQGAMPAVRPNVILHKGWFEDTLPNFVAQNPGPVAFLHVDCDLYSSTKTIFEHLADRIVPGTVMLFDEYFNYPGWQEHEHKAFQELVKERNLKYRWLAYNSTEWNAALVITG